ncbi:MAG: hypothetical protein LUC22_07130 [Prevotella sp.]|nr:hypothetical protein [Prevotella sp.]
MKRYIKPETNTRIDAVGRTFICGSPTLHNEVGGDQYSKRMLYWSVMEEEEEGE